MMMSRYGGDATLVVDSGDGEYDPATSTTTPNVTEYRIRILAQDYIQKTSGIMSQTGGLVQTGDKQFFIQPDDAVPAPRVGVDYIIFEGKKWMPITLKDYNPSGVKSYLYEVYARQ
jgi:hypothetical protein